MACGCGSRVCSCSVVQGAGISVAGTGSSGNPYVITATGGATVVTTTIAGMNALATAGSLVVGTKYIITDWVSGAGSLPGPNLLILDALSANTPSGFVQIKTPLGPLGPSDGEFVWNYASVVSFMVRVRDALGNDVGGVSSTVIDQFPWGNIAISGNTIRDGSLIGWTSAFGLANNVFQDATIDLTGATAVTINDSNFQLGFLQISGGTHNIHDLNIGNDAGMTLTTDTEINGVSVGYNGAFDVTSTGTTVIRNCKVNAHVILNSTGAASSFYACNFTDDAHTGATPLTLQGAVQYLFTQVDFSLTSAITIDGAGGVVTLLQSRLVDPTITRNAAATGNVTIEYSDLLGGILTFGAANTGATILQGVRGTGKSGVLFEIDSLGAGLFRIQDTAIVGSAIATTAAVVRDLTVVGCTLADETSVTYSRSAVASGSDTIQGCSLSGAVLTITGATDPGLGQTYLGNTVVGGSQVTVTNGATALPLSFTQVEAGSILNVTAGGRVGKSRVAGGGTLNSGAFTQASVFHDSNATTTLTAANTNTMKNPLGSNVV